MKLKKILLGVLAVLTLGIISIANAPRAYADELDRDPDVEVTNASQTYGTDPNKFKKIDGLIDEIEGDGVRIVGIYKLEGAGTLYNFDITIKNYELVVNSSDFPEELILELNPNGKYDVKTPSPYSGTLFIFDFTPETITYTGGGGMTVTMERDYFNYYQLIDSSRTLKIYFLKIAEVPEEEPGDVITPGGSGTPVPPIVNDEGIINPIYLYTALGVVVLAVGGYIISLGNKKRKK